MNSELLEKHLDCFHFPLRYVQIICVKTSFEISVIFDRFWALISVYRFSIVIDKFVLSKDDALIDFAFHVMLIQVTLDTLDPMMTSLSRWFIYCKGETVGTPASGRMTDVKGDYDNWCSGSSEQSRGLQCLQCFAIPS